MGGLLIAGTEMPRLRKSKAPSPLLSPCCVLPCTRRIFRRTRDRTASNRSKTGPCGLPICLRSANRPPMRQLHFLFLLALLLVSHGGLPGSIPHLEAAHAHEAASAHHAHEHNSADVIEVETDADSLASEDIVPHPASHSHSSIAMPDQTEFAGNAPAPRTLLRPGETPPLIGFSPAPLTQPPSA